MNMGYKNYLGTDKNVFIQKIKSNIIGGLYITGSCFTDKEEELCNFILKGR